MLKKDGYYYLFEAEGGTGPGHRITVSRSKELMGRYEPCPYNPIMRQFDENAIIQRCGHGKPVQTQNGDWYMVYLCGRKIGDGYSILGRETALDPITWTADGWPIVNNLDGPSAMQIKPNLPETVWESQMCDDFNESTLSTDWTFPRVPEMDGIVIKDSHVYIKGSKEDLNSMHAKNILLRRQQHFKFTAECKCAMPQLYPGQDAGITCYYDENTFLKFGLFTEPAESEENSSSHTMKINIIQHIDEEDIACESIPVDTKQRFVYLRIVTNYLKRSFYYSYDGAEYTHFATLDNVYYLCDEGLKKGKRFTGAMVGMYAHAGEEYEYISEFDYFQYKPVF